MVATTSSTRFERSRSRTATGVTLILLVSAAVGIVTPIAERHLPHSLSSMANSSGSWMLVTFVTIALSRLRPAAAALMGAVSFLTMNATFYLVFELHGYYPKTYIVFWSFIAVAIGPLVGLSASWLRSPSAPLRVIAAAAPSSVLVGEGIYMLQALPGISTPYSLASIVVGVALFIALATTRLRSPALVLLSLVLATVSSVAFIQIYGLIPLALNKVVP